MITGANVAYAGGGGGATWNGGVSTSGAGGAGGGGTGGSYSPSIINGAAGIANSGGGGGGGPQTSPGQVYAGNGGSGVVILRIPSTYTATFSAGITANVGISTSQVGYRTYTVTGGTGTVTFS